MEKFFVHFPAQFALDFSCAGNTVRQLLHPAVSETVTTRPLRIGKQDCLVATRTAGNDVLIVTRPIREDAFTGDILRVQATTLDAVTLAADTPRRWLRIRGKTGAVGTPQEAKRRAAQVLHSWKEQFAYRVENQITGEEGLRPPQMGALFATLAHWTVSPEDPATIAMPTGTGKTETMLALLVNQRLSCILVIVPNSALRD